MDPGDSRPGVSVYRCLGLILLIVVAACAGTRGKLEQTADEATSLLAILRPRANVDDIRVSIFRAASAREALDKARARPDFLDVGALLRLQLRIPVRLHVLDQAEADALVEEFSGRDARMTDSFGVAFPSEGFVLVREEHVSSLSIVAHEFAHVITYREGHFARRRPDAFLATEENPERLDLDALLTLWALSEGDAEFTSQAVVQWKDRGAVVLDEIPTQKLRTDLSEAGPTLSGPAKLTLPDGDVVEVKKGERYSLPPSSLQETLLHFVYEVSPRTFWLAQGEGGTLESAIRSTWERTPLRSMSILSDENPPPPSTAELLDAVSMRLWADDQVSHLGAVLVWDYLVRKAGESPQAASALLEAFVDDLAILRGKKATWIVRWRTEAAANGFAVARTRLFSEKPLREVDDGGTHVVICGNTDLGKALLGK